MAVDLLLFIAIAEISGVFVGFGALIGVSGRDEIEPSQLQRLRGLVTVGLVVVIAALIPVLITSYGFIDHILWFWSSLIFLCLNWSVMLWTIRQPESRAVMKSMTRANPVKMALFWLLLEVPLELPLFIVILGLFPDLDSAFYLTGLLFLLFQAAYTLATVVYSKSEQPSEVT